MRRIIVSVILLLSLILTSSISIYNPEGLQSSLEKGPSTPERINLQADAYGLGNNVAVVQFMDREVTDQLLSISNSFTSPDTHTSEIDLSAYQIPGWTLYEVQINTENITAIAEREVIGISMDTDLYRIEEYDIANEYRYTSLAQGFYLEPYDGKLLNYSFYYDSPIYSPAQHGWAYYSVLSNYQNPSSNLMSYTQLPTRVITGAGWENVTSTSISLNADTQYYVVIKISALKIARIRF